VRPVLLIALALVACTANAQPLAWRASLPGADGELLLLGSIHALRSEDYPLPPLVDALYQRSESLAMELDLDDIDPLTMQTLMVGAALIEDGRGLKALLEPELYELAYEEAGELGIDLEMFDRFEPWFVALTLSSLGIVRFGYQPEMGLEQYLVSRARSDRKEVLGLEDLEDQVAIFDGLSASEQAAMLAQTLEELQRTPSTMAELIEAWKTGRLGELSERLLGEFEEFPRLYDDLVTNRNKAWASRLASLVEHPGSILVVVGALHLVGPDNVIDLLRARGFEIEQLR